MKSRFLLLLTSSLVLTLAAPAAFAGVAIGISVPLAPVVSVYAPPAIVVAPPEPVVVAPVPVVVAPAPVVMRLVYAAPAYPAFAVRAGYWPHGVVMVR
jgi:hypothetical protein